MEAPLYVYFPSVRPIVSNTVAKWFVHAIEARGKPELIPNLLAESEKKGVSEGTSKILKGIARNLKNRQIIGNEEARIKREVHFVVADVAPFYYEKPASELHTGKFRELTQILNKIGNKSGVFVHHISSEEYRDAIPSKFILLGNNHPQFHLNMVSKIKSSPGAASNIALSYIRSIANSHPSIGVMRMDDDRFPQLFKMKWGEFPRSFRNFFHDALTQDNGGSFGTYFGYVDAFGRKESKANPVLNRFTLNLLNPQHLRYINTRMNEDYTIPEGKEVLEVPDYILSVGKHSTWFNDLPENKEPTKNASFGRYAERGLVDAFPQKIAEAIIKNSGIKRK
ncbi:hypothetical protein HY989_00055 [Candidatus Micrarchaeota archaeon]|nr:hypothetical protein [Candidatus Micrarchaeota archaeon]